MKVKELIAELQKVNGNLEVRDDNTGRILRDIIIQKEDLAPPRAKPKVWIRYQYS
jgi:hypothetical protein